MFLQGDTICNYITSARAGLELLQQRTILIHDPHATLTASGSLKLHPYLREMVQERSKW